MGRRSRAEVMANEAHIAKRGMIGILDESISALI
jgi:hypothetical protein